MASNVMHTFNTACSFEKLDTKKVNLSAILSNEKIVNGNVVARGKFKWPNGCEYEGDYCGHLRHGQGTQVWSDGSKYTGDFVNDLRHGHGCMQWTNGEVYEGTYFKDRCHGRGSYRWPDNSSYSGMFYMDKKQGFGTFYFSNGNKFEGLYLEDEREGPGVATSTEIKQNVGIWRSEKIIRLCSEISGAFTIKDYPEYEYHPKEVILTLDDKGAQQQLAPISSIIYPLSILDYPPKTDLTSKLTDLFCMTSHPQSLSIDRHSFDTEYFNNVLFNDIPPEKRIAWNLTPGMVSLQKHFLKHLFGKSEVSIDVEAIIQLNRSKFQESGLLEQLSEEFIKVAQDGQFKRVEEMLNSQHVDPDVADCHGHTALIGATVNTHTDIINILLNRGANINQVNDVGCSALSVAAVFYFPFHRFVDNFLDVTKTNQESNISTDTYTVENPLEKSKSESASEKKKLIDDNSIVDDQSSLIVDTSFIKSNNVTNIDGDLIFNDDNEAESKEFVENNNEIDPEDFESIQSLKNYQIEVSNQLIEKCATQLSSNKLVVGRDICEANQMDKARLHALEIFHHNRMRDTLKLLLERGANPNISSVPMPVLFMSVRSADVDITKLLLMKGADANSRLPSQNGGLYPIHFASFLPGKESVQITELLLDALADPDARANEDNSFLNHLLEEEWSKDKITEESLSLLGGRTALHIACSRKDNMKNAASIVHLLLEHKANANLICNGFSALALAIANGNDLAVDELLMFGADPSLPLTHGVGSALCVAASTQYEHHRTLEGRLQLINKLIKFGANVLAPVAIGPKRIMGTVVDYAYYIFNQDQRIAHVPYHALTPSERETFNARRKLLSHLGDTVRTKAVEREREKNMEDNGRTQSPSSNFLYIGAGAQLPTDLNSKFGYSQAKMSSSNKEGKMRNPPLLERKPLFKYCYDCGRSVGVRLTACTRCKEVYYCSKACKLKAWNARHKNECIRIGDRHSSRSATKKANDLSISSNQSKNVTSSSQNLISNKLTQGSAGKERRLFLTGTPPYSEYVYIDNYSHN